MPKFLQDAPALFPENVLYWRAFSDLHTCRPGGFGASAIPWTTIRQWADENDLDDDQRYVLGEAISKMDGAYLDWNQRKAETEKAAARTGGH